MSSVRSRLESGEEPHVVTPTPTRNTPRVALSGGAPTPMRRELESAAQYVDDPGTPISRGRATGLTSFHNPTTTSPRFRAEMAQARASERPPRSNLIDIEFAEYKRREAQAKRDAEEEERLQRERVAKRKADQAESARNFIINLALSSVSATPAEVERVKKLLTQIPAETRTHEKVVGMIWGLRELQTFAARAKGSAEAEIASPWARTN